MAILNSNNFPLGMTDSDARRVAQSTQPQSGLLSSIGRGASGLLGALGSGGSALGSALGSGGSAFAQSLSANAPQMTKDILDAQRFYQMERMKSSGPVLASQLGQLNRVTPAGVVAGLPQYRAAEQAAIQEPELDKLKAEADKLRAAGSQSAQKTAPKTFLLPDGKSVVETYFDKISGQRLVSGTNEPLPAGSLEFGAGDVPTFKNLSDFNEKATEEEAKLIALDKFKNAVQTAPEGLGRTLQIMNMILQTLSSDPEFDKGDLATGEARARLQGLIGRYKEEIVGGGVMTEQDAIRVIEALGGSISAFNPKELQITLIDSFRENSEKKYQSALQRYNNAYETTLPTMAGKRIFSKRKAYVNPFELAVNDEDDSSVVDELLKLYP